MLDESMDDETIVGTRMLLLFLWMVVVAYLFVYRNGLLLGTVISLSAHCDHKQANGHVLAGALSTVISIANHGEPKRKLLYSL